MRTHQVLCSLLDDSEQAASSTFDGIEGGEAGWAVGVGSGASGNLFSKSREPGVCAGPGLVMREEGGTG